jgi:3-hydroxybutyryl-CoA dehydrogenase
MPQTLTQDATAATGSSGVSSVAIIGFGTMGSGIAHVCALAGLPVRVVEPSQEAIERDLAQIDRFLARGVEKGRLTEQQRSDAMGRIDAKQALEHAFGCDLVIEAVTERLDVKQQIFRELDASMPADAILATNTSALSVTEIASATTRPERVVGLHFFNPAPVLPLVEVVSAERTDPAVAERAYNFVHEIGKSPIRCSDTPGFVVNRILIPLVNDVMRVFEHGVASAEDIDTGCRDGLNWPIGPLALADLIGLDVHEHASEALYASYREPRVAPPPVLQRMVKAGKLGRKSGEGFYRYPSK